MKKSVNITGAVILLLCVAIVAMSFGFAAYEQNLSIGGNVTIAASKWSVHYNGTTYAETTGTNATAATSKTITDTSFNFDVNLTKPGDFYEATINVVNDGTFDAKLSSITMGGVDANNSSYLKYTITYDGTEYSSTNTTVNSSLTAGQTKPVKVRVEFLQPADPQALPMNGATATISGTLAYVQA